MTGLRNKQWRVATISDERIVQVHNSEPDRYRIETAVGLVIDSNGGTMQELLLHSTWRGNTVTLFVDCVAGRITKCRMGDRWAVYYVDDTTDVVYVHEQAGRELELRKQLAVWKKHSIAFFRNPGAARLVELIWMLNEYTFKDVWLWVSKGVTGDYTFQVDPMDMPFHTPVSIMDCLGKLTDLVGEMQRPPTTCQLIFWCLTSAVTRCVKVRGSPEGHMGDVHVVLASMVNVAESHKPVVHEVIAKVSDDHLAKEVLGYLNTSLRETTDLLASWAASAASALNDDHVAGAPNKTAARRKRSKEHRRLAATARKHDAVEKKKIADEARDARARADATEAVRRALALAEAECATAGAAAATKRVAEALRKHHDKCDPAVKKAATAKRLAWSRPPPPPDELVCPITLELMRDPVVLAGDGKVYEREAIEAWLAKELVSPMTGLALGDATLSPDEASRAKADEYRASRKSKPKLTDGNEPPSTFPAPSHASPAT